MQALCCVIMKNHCSNQNGDYGEDTAHHICMRGPSLYPLGDWARSAPAQHAASEYIFSQRVPCGDGDGGGGGGSVVYFPNKLSMFMRRAARCVCPRVCAPAQHGTLYYFTIQLFGKLHYARSRTRARTVGSLVLQRARAHTRPMRDRTIAHNWAHILLLLRVRVCVCVEYRNR